MRTTLTIDDDVAVRLERLRRAGNASLRELINEALRRGIKEMTARARPLARFRTRSVDLGRLRIGSLDSIGDVLAVGEREGFC